MQHRILSWKIYIFDQSKSLLNENHLGQNFEMSRFLDSQEFLENSREISLLDLDLEANSFHFSLSISILRNFHFTFHSRSRSQGIFISLFILEMSETDFHFTFHFSKWVNKIFISLFTSRTFNIHSRRTLPGGPKFVELPGSWLDLGGIHPDWCNGTFKPIWKCHKRALEQPKMTPNCHKWGLWSHKLPWWPQIGGTAWILVGSGWDTPRLMYWNL